MPPTLTQLSRLLHHNPGLSLTQVGILLCCQSGRKTLEEMAKALSQSPTTIGVQVRQLTWNENNTLVRKHYTPQDKRRLFVSLTDAGQQLLNHAQED